MKQKERSLNRNTSTSRVKPVTRGYSRFHLIANLLVVLELWLSLIFVITAQPVEAFDATSPPLPTLNELSVESLYEMVQMGHGDEALELIVQLAQNLGGWGPAGHDVVVYDRYMQDQFRGAVLDYDEIPVECSGKSSPDPEMCVNSFLNIETQVRFGEFLFVDRTPASELVPRANLDDILATYIEEVGHSWQEYLYETDGRGSGERLHPTTLIDAKQLAPGREYQIKMYILNLDDKVLQLSHAERQHLLGQICLGYANPVGAEVPSYPAPLGWPNSEGWPIDNPPQDFLVDLCKSVS